MKGNTKIPNGTIGTHSEPAVIQQERRPKTIKPDAILSDANMSTNWQERIGLMFRIDGGNEAIDLGMMEGVVL